MSVCRLIRAALGSGRVAVRLGARCCIAADSTCVGRFYICKVTYSAYNRSGVHLLVSSPLRFGLILASCVGKLVFDTLCFSVHGYAGREYNRSGEHMR